MLNPKDCLKATQCVDSEHDSIHELAAQLTSSSSTSLEKALALYYFVRDEILYNPYTAAVSVESLRASNVLEAKQGWCVSKAALLAALARAAGIPACLGYADVVNHLSTAKLRATMGTDVFYFHGYCSLYLDDQWVKATPAFNLSLCEKFGLLPMEFDGKSDSLYHPFDVSGNKHMEYVNQRGEYLDVPLEEMQQVFETVYPNMREAGTEQANTQRQWEAEVKSEVGQLQAETSS